jgi:NAD(P)-dependent dehydrogenase (short-subunit alcohol dehydrogenase family)
MFEQAVGPAAHRARFIGMIPQKRAGTPDEAANLILFLASDKSPFVTGEIVSIDGGYSAA